MPYYMGVGNPADSPGAQTMHRNTPTGEQRMKTTIRHYFTLRRVFATYPPALCWSLACLYSR